MAVPRVFTIDDVQFTIHQEMQATVDSTDKYRYAKKIKDEVWPIEWTNTDDKESDALKVRSGQIKHTAKVSAKGPGDTELKVCNSRIHFESE